MTAPWVRGASAATPFTTQSSSTAHGSSSATPTMTAPWVSGASAATPPTPFRLWPSPFSHAIPSGPPGLGSKRTLRRRELRARAHQRNTAQEDRVRLACDAVSVKSWDIALFRQDDFTWRQAWITNIALWIANIATKTKLAFDAFYLTNFDHIDNDTTRRVWRKQETIQDRILKHNIYWEELDDVTNRLAHVFREHSANDYDNPSDSHHMQHRAECDET